MIMKRLIIFYIILSFQSCSDEKLLIERTPYSGSELRIEGYYYIYDTDGTRIKFLYRNGIMIDFIGGFSTTNLIEIDQKIADEYERWKNNKLIWQVFLIKGNSIQYSGWSTSVGGGRPSFKTIGVIENDTTFRLTKSINSDGEEFERNDLYHFRQFSPKPDSTNTFIK